MAAVPEMLGARYYRNTLCPQGQAIYDKIDEQLRRKDYSGKTTFSFPAETPSEVAFSAHTALCWDRPDYFLLPYSKELTRCPKSQSAVLSYEIPYSAEIIARIEPQLQRALRRYTHGTEHMSVLEREATIYERICTSLRYNYNFDDGSNYNVVGPSLLKRGVCSGIADLLVLAFRAAKIPSIWVCGKAGADVGNHAWCIAYVYGEPMHLDPTWDLNEHSCQFKYFNLSDRQITALNHFVNYSEYKGPKCTSEDLSQFNPHRDRIRIKYA